MSQLVSLLIGVIILLFISFLSSQYDFFSPSIVICALFLLGTLFAIYATASWGVSDNVFTYESTFIILSGISVFIVGEKIARSVASRRRSKIIGSFQNEKIIKVPTWKLLMVILLCLGSMAIYIFYLYRYVRANGYSGGFVSSQISSFYHKMTFMDETEGGIPRFAKILSEFTNAIMYVCLFIFLNNVVLCRDKIKANLGLLMPIVCWFPRVLYTSSRTNYVRLVGFAVLVIYIMMNRRGKWQKKKRNFKKIIKISVLSVILVFGLFYLAVANGLIGRTADKTFFDYIAVYVGAPIIHLNQFLTNPPAAARYFGEETFAGLNSIFIRLGLRSSTYTAQLEMRTIAGLYRGNVYTFFRRPLHDFGYVGMYIITFLTGYLYSYVYYKKIYQTHSSYRTDRTIIIYGYLFYVIFMFSIMNNYCNFLSINLAYFLVAVWISYAFLTGKIRIRRRKSI